MSTPIVLTTEEILSQWHIQGALWLMDVGLVNRNVDDFLHAIRMADASHMELLYDIAGFYQNKSLTYAVLYNKHITTEVLHRLAAHPDFNIRELVARHPLVSATLLEFLYIDAKMPVLIAIVENHKTPAHILQEHAAHADLRIRSGVAQNPNTPVELLPQLSQDKIVFVRKGVAAHPHVPIEILLQLLQDTEQDVRNAVLQNPVYQQYMRGV